jgi:hypothetical protein
MLHLFVQNLSHFELIRTLLLLIEKSLSLSSQSLFTMVGLKTREELLVCQGIYTRYE